MRIRLRAEGVSRYTITRLDSSRLHFYDSAGRYDQRVSDISFLRSYSLDELSLRNTQVSDLRPLADMHSLKSLDVSFTPVTSIAVVAQLPLISFWLDGTRVTDLTPLHHTGIRDLSIRRVPVSDLSPLARMRCLRTLDCSETAVTDLSPLTNVHTLSRLACTLEMITNGVSDVRSMPAITWIGKSQGKDPEGSRLQLGSPIKDGGQETEIPSVPVNEK